MDLNDKKLDMRTDVEKMRYEGLESMTRKQVDEVEKNVNNAQAKYDRNKDKLERIEKALINAKAGIEHLCEKLNEIKLAGLPNVVVSDNTLVEAMIQCEQKLETIIQLIKSEPILYEEALQKIRGGKKEDGDLIPEPLGNMMVTTSLLATGYDRP